MSAAVDMSKVGVKGDALPPVLGIVVASTSRNGHEHGRPVLLALRHVLELVQVQEPFLFLVSVTGSLQYYRPDGAGTWVRGEKESSAVAAQRMWSKQESQPGEGGRLLLVHLDHSGKVVHSGLLPWLTLFNENLETEPVLLHDVLKSIVTKRTPVLVATSRAHAKGHVDAMLQSVWTGLMTRLDHREKR